MAKPISSTPILRGEDAERFLKNMLREEKRPLSKRDKEMIKGINEIKEMEGKYQPLNSQEIHQYLTLLIKEFNTVVKGFKVDNDCIWTIEEQISQIDRLCHLYLRTKQQEQEKERYLNSKSECNKKVNNI